MTTDSIQSPFSCESVKPAGHMGLISASDWLSPIFIYVTDAQVVRQRDMLPLSLTCRLPLVFRSFVRLGEEPLRLHQTDVSEPTNELTPRTTYPITEQTDENHLINHRADLLRTFILKVYTDQL